MNPKGRIRNRNLLPSLTGTVAFLLIFLTVGSALAVDQPPQEPEQQHAPGSSVIS